MYIYIYIYHFVIDHHHTIQYNLMVWFGMISIYHQSMFLCLYHIYKVYHIYHRCIHNRYYPIYHIKYFTIHIHTHMYHISYHIKYHVFCQRNQNWYIVMFIPRFSHVYCWPISTDLRASSICLDKSPPDLGQNNESEVTYQPPKHIYYIRKHVTFT